MFSRFIHRLWRYPLGTRVMGSVLLFSFAVALLSILVQFYWDYRSQKAEVITKVENVVDALVPALVNSLWVLDDSTTVAVLDGLMELPEVYNVTLVTEKGDVVIRGEQPGGQSTLPFQRELLAVGAVERDSLGELTVLASLEPLYQRIMNSLSFSLLFQLAKMLLIVAFFLVVFWWLVSRHLEKLSNYALDVGAIDHPGDIALSRQVTGQDELSRVEDAFNQLSERIRKQNRELQFAREESDRLIEEAHESVLIQQDLCANLLENLRDCLSQNNGETEPMSLSGWNADDEANALIWHQTALTDLCFAMALIRRRRSGRSAAFDLREELGRSLRSFAEQTGGLCGSQVLLEEGFPTQVAGDAKLFRSALTTLTVGLSLLNEPSKVSLQGQLVHRASMGYRRVRVNVEDDGRTLSRTAQDLLSNLQLTDSATNLKQLSGYVKLFLFELQMSVLQADYGFVCEGVRGNSVWLEMTLKVPGQQSLTLEDNSLPSVEVLGVGLSAKTASCFERIYGGRSAHLTNLKGCEELDDYLPFAWEIAEPPRLALIDVRNLGTEMPEDCTPLMNIQNQTRIQVVVIVDAKHLPSRTKLEVGGVSAVIVEDDLDDLLPVWFQENWRARPTIQHLWLSPSAKRLYWEAEED